MKLICTLLLLFVVALTAQAAPWDGTKGPLTVATVTFSSGTGTNLPGVPGIPGPLVWHTTVFIKCADSEVTAARVRLEYRDESGDHVISLLADFVQGYGGVTLAVPLEKVLAVKITALRDGPTY